MITKAIVQSINANGTRCIVRMPLFESSASTAPIEAEALISITPGVFNNLSVGDRVFVAFEENAIEKPIIVGKLFRGADIEGHTKGGGAIFNTLKVSSTASLPASTTFAFPAGLQSSYVNLTSFKQIADYVKWLESFTKKNVTKQEDNFKCFKNWAQWQLKPENVEIDDGDIDNSAESSDPFLYQEEGATCRICTTCSKDNTRNYSKLSLDKNYPNT